MNYRHSFHAGNSADVVKHSLLIALVRALQHKQGALTLIDTRAGCGLYDLGGEESPTHRRGHARACFGPSPTRTPCWTTTAPRTGGECRGRASLLPRLAADSGTASAPAGFP